MRNYILSYKIGPKCRAKNMEYRKRLRVWQATVVAVVILGIVAFQCSRRTQKVDDSLRFAIGVSLVREYMGEGLKQQAQEHLKQKVSGDAPTELSPSATPIPNVVLGSVKAHGSPDVVIAEVEVTMNGGPPPDGRSVRYLDVIRSADGSWLVVADSDAYHYTLSLLSQALSKRRAYYTDFR
jgi:hypothetical protein